MRLFFAIALSSIARNSLSEYTPKVKERLDRQGLRWTTPEKWHVTLLFVGDEDPETVRTMAGEALKDQKEVRILVDKINGLPDTKRPGVLYLSVSALTGDLNAIHKALSNVFPLDDEEYLPHITLARMKPASTKLGHKLRDFMHSGAIPEDIQWTAESVTLYNTLLDGSYEVIAEFPLSRI
jgi:RNA 2',3'-cyclic 3'-phosphodiesterase